MTTASRPLFSFPYFKKRRPPPLREKAAYFEEHGYVIFENAVAHDLIDAFWADVNRQMQENPALTFSVNDKIFTNAERPNVPEAKGSTVLRIIDIERHSALAPQMMLHPVCSDFLKEVYGGVLPTCLQTLTYEHSSQQAEHSDKYLVSPPTVGPFYDRETLAASWIACEDANEENGALIIYPGSHKLPKERYEDFCDYGAYVAHLKQLCADAGIEPKTFTAKKGDVLFWHGDFVHAGGPILSRARTRKSLVSHYARVPADHAFEGNTRERRYLDGGSYFA
jgi:ectoine hydroxylase-related dioxygenase (phytanoyl-CoA dioxygenase family)